MMFRKLLLLAIFAYLSGVSLSIMKFENEDLDASGSTNFQDDKYEALRGEYVKDLPFRSDLLSDYKQRTQQSLVESKSEPVTGQPAKNRPSSNPNFHAEKLHFDSVTGSIPNFSPFTEHISHTTSRFANNPKRGIVSTEYIFYQRGNGSVHYYKFPNVVPKKETYFLIHGIAPKYQEDYINDFFTKISTALTNTNVGNVIGVKWAVRKKSHINHNIEQKAAVIVGKRLGKIINDMRSKMNVTEPIDIISHDLGNVAAGSIFRNIHKQVDYLFGLDQRKLSGSYKDFYLRRDFAKVVQTISTKSFEFDYGHRNFYPDLKNYKLDYSNKRGECFFCQSYELLADDINEDGFKHISTFCSSLEDYVKDLCKNFSSVSYFNKLPARLLPVGRYFAVEK